MQAGNTASYDGYQYALFPIDYLKCNQSFGHGTYSHCCGCPQDWGYPGSDTTHPYYAPCDCHRIHTYAANGQTIYTSDNPVWTPSGLKYISFLFAHDNNIPAQTSFHQGELIGHMGTKSTSGLLTGAHLHMDQSLKKDSGLVNYGTCDGYTCWAIANPAPANTVFYLYGNETIVSTCGFKFETVPAQPEPPQPPQPPATGSGAVKLLLLYGIEKKRRSNNGRIKRNTILL